MVLTVAVLWDNWGDLLAPAKPSPVAAAMATQSQIDQGRYLALAGNCMACHTTRGGTPLAGGRRIDTPFGGVYSSNLTPDPETGLGRWTPQDFWQAMHRGRSADGRLLTPAFPYNHTSVVTREDSDAIFAWLNTLAPVPQAQPAHTMTGIIAQELGEVPVGSVHYRALFVVGILLFAIVLGINATAHHFTRKMKH
jgi:mono/diheme cytochrome c family protein